MEMSKPTGVPMSVDPTEMEALIREIDATAEALRSGLRRMRARLTGEETPSEPTPQPEGLLGATQEARNVLAECGSLVDTISRMV